jgi:CheY-like chemotaxis protein
VNRRNLNALVAGDNQALRAILASVLSGLGVGEIRQALDGGDAFRKICQRPPDFVVLDFEHHSDLVTTVRAIRRSPDSPRHDLPIVVTSAVATRSSIESIMREGVDRILLKPVRTSALDSCIEYFLSTERKFVVAADYAGRERRVLDRPAADNVDLPENDSHDILDLDVA